jgi:hypothetical protein
MIFTLTRVLMFNFTVIARRIVEILMKKSEGLQPWFTTVHLDSDSVPLPYESLVEFLL